MTKSSKEVTVSKAALERTPHSVLFGDIDHMLEDFFRPRWLRPFAWQWPFVEMAASEPNMDVIDCDDQVVVRAEVPGYKKEDIEISASNGSLTIKGETKTEEKEEKGDYYRCEISHGAFSRTITLPAAVDDSKAKATIKDGVLELTLPKLEKSKRHTIAIS